MAVMVSELAGMNRPDNNATFQFWDTAGVQRDAMAAMNIHAQPATWWL